MNPAATLRYVARLNPKQRIAAGRVMAEAGWFETGERLVKAVGFVPSDDAAKLLFDAINFHFGDNVERIAPFLPNFMNDIAEANGVTGLMDKWSQQVLTDVAVSVITNGLLEVRQFEQMAERLTLIVRNSGCYKEKLAGNLIMDIWSRKYDPAGSGVIKFNPEEYDPKYDLIDLAVLVIKKLNLEPSSAGEMMTRIPSLFTRDLDKSEFVLSVVEGLGYDGDSKEAFLAPLKEQIGNSKLIEEEELYFRSIIDAVV
jgi:hypothetical protein